MSDKNKKRTSSFRKIFPSLFGGHSSKSRAKECLKSRDDEQMRDDIANELGYDVYGHNVLHDSMVRHSDSTDKDSACYEHINPYGYKITDSVNTDLHHIHIDDQDSKRNVSSSNSTLVFAGVTHAGKKESVDTDLYGQKRSPCPKTYNSDVLNGNMKFNDTPSLRSAYRDTSARDYSIQNNVLDLNQNIDEVFDSNLTKQSFIVQNATLNRINSDDSSNYELNNIPTINSDRRAFFPKVYYHNLLDKHTDNELNRSASPKPDIQSSDISSVSAEIKSFNTGIMTAPKKNAEVRVRKQMRARSLSIEKLVNKSNQQKTSRMNEAEIKSEITNVSDYNIDKPYTYTAPTAFTTTQKIPNMPELHKNVSPYAEVRKKIAKGEVHQPRANISTPQNLQTRRTEDVIQNQYFIPPENTGNMVKSDMPKHQVRQANSSDVQKLRNRQNVEAFYWQQIKQIKLKQEQDFMKKSTARHKVASATANPYKSTEERLTLRNQTVATKVNEKRSTSLPGGITTNTERYITEASLQNSPVSRLKKYDPYAAFIRGAQIRNTTGSFNTPKSLQGIENIDIVYRHPEKLQKFKSISRSDRAAGPFDHRVQERSHSAQLFYNVSAKDKRVSFASTRSSDASQDNSTRITHLSADKFSNHSEVVLKSPNVVKHNVIYGQLTHPQFRPTNHPIYGKIKYEQSLNSSVCKELLCQHHNSAERNRNRKRIDLIKRTGQSPPPPSMRTPSSNWNSAASTARHLLSRRLHAARSSYDTEKGSETRSGHLLQSRKEDEWESDRGGDGGVSDGEVASRATVRMRPSHRDDPRRHTLGGAHSCGPLHHHQAMMGSMDGLESRAREITRWIHDGAEYSFVNKEPPPITVQCSPRQPFPPGTYQPSNSSMTYDDDPGIMSEVETSSTGFRRGGKQRSSLPVVRTPSKTLERPLGLVFLQFRSETKRALLPNEVTSIDTVKALFVRSFNSLLSMEYLESPEVKVYIHDSSKDMFYELEDSRSHLRDIRDRSVLRLFELKDLGVGKFPGAVGGRYTSPGVLGFQGSTGEGGGRVSAPVSKPGGSGPPSLDQDQSYFSEPEIDSEYNHQHIHKSNKMNAKPPAYYMGTSRAPTTLPRTGGVMRAYSPGNAPVPADRVKSLPPPGAPPKPMRGGYGPPVRGGSERGYPLVAPSGPDQLYNMPPGGGADGYTSSPERISRGSYEDPYYNQFTQGSRPTMTTVINEEATDGAMMEDQYSMYGVNMPPGRGIPRSPYDPRLGLPNEEVAQRMRVEHMERQLANLTAIVHKGFSHPPDGSMTAGYSQRHPSVQDPPELYRHVRNPKLGQSSHQKSVSFEKSVSFSDDPPDMNSPKQHSPQLAADPKPTKPAIKSSTLPRMSSQDRDRPKPAPPPKPVGLGAQSAPLGGTTLAGRLLPTHIAQPFISDLRSIYNKCRDIRAELNHMKRLTKIQADSMKDFVTDTMETLHQWADTSLLKENNLMKADDIAMRSLKEEMDYRFDMAEMEEDLFHLEEKVEKLRGKAAIKDIKVDMDDVEDIALVLSKSSNTVGKWKEKAEDMANDAKHRIDSTVKKIEDTEKLVEQMPDRIEDALRRCKKLTGTLVTLKRLACVQEQRLPNSADEALSPQLAALAAASQSEEMALVKEIHAHAYEIREAHARAAHARDVHAHHSTYEAGHNRGHANEGRAHGHDGHSRAHDMHDAHAHSHDHNGHGHGAHGHEDLSSSGSSRMNTPQEQKVVGPGVGRDGVEAVPGAEVRRAENALDALLDELQTFARPPDACDPSPPPRASLQAKPPVPERHPDLVAIAGRRAPPPPPPRHTSRSPLASPTSPPAPRQRDLLHKQKSLQEQYARLAEPSAILTGTLSKTDLAGVETVTTYETDIL